MVDLLISMDSAVALFQQRAYDEAERICRRVLHTASQDAVATHLLALIYSARNEFEQALGHFDRAVMLDPTKAHFYANRANVLVELTQWEKALADYDFAIALDSTLAAAHINKGILLQKLHRFEESFEALLRAVPLQPSDSLLYNHLGNTARALGDLSQACDFFQRALALNDVSADIHNNYGVTLKDLGRLVEALDQFLISTKLMASMYISWNNLGGVLLSLRRPDEALEAFNVAVFHKPDYAEAHNNRANALFSLGRLDDALFSYERSLAFNPQESEVWANRGVALKAIWRLQDALLSLEKALELNPRNIEALLNRGNVLQQLARNEEALASYDGALALDQKSPELWNNRGFILQDLVRLPEALASHQRALYLAPHLGAARGAVAQVASKMCAWSITDEQLVHLTDNTRTHDLPITPFVLLGLTDDARLHGMAARRWAVERIKGVATPMASRAIGPRIHVAYCSADFHAHATSYLLVQLLEMHDRSRFEITGISFGPDQRDGMRQRVVSAFDRFVDVSGMSDREVAMYCRSIGVDIAVDLKGYTQDSRPGIFAHRAAPLQINWLGYPGTMGATFMDYIVADRVLIRPDEVALYTEKVIWLPHSYQVNDGKRAIATEAVGRAGYGLPPVGFVFCCFNNNYKIRPQTFSVWMRLLRRLEGSVMWLLEDNPWAAENLREQAQRQGVDPQRLIFAKRVPLAEHLARHRLADLFLDTWPYNAHTTASDALWAGLPVVTYCGSSFATRVGASLLEAIGLPELITTTQQDYEALALALALDPERLGRLRQKLAANRLTEPLFDCQRFTKHLELAYEQIVQRHHQGLAVSSHMIDPMPASLSPGPNVLSPDAPDNTTNLSRDVGARFGPNATEPVTLEAILSMRVPLAILDIGAAFLGEFPVYQPILSRGLGHLHAFEGDDRHSETIRQTFGEHVTLYRTMLFDGTPQTVYVAEQASGMTSLLKPRAQALGFFNGFETLGRITRTETTQTQRLDEVKGLPAIDFLKMDIQGAELTVLKNGLRVLSDCVAVQLEVSYIALYEGQPSFGEVDVWLRTQGFVPHRFLDIKRWSITPTVRNGNFRQPFNQLLESDIVYVRDPLGVDGWETEAIKKLALLAHYSFGSPDLCMHLLLALGRRDHGSAHAAAAYLELINSQQPVASS